MNLNLENDERIIISTAGIRWISDNGRMLEDFVLTNKGLYCIYKVKNGIFSKAEDEVYRFELTDIIIEEGVSRIEQVKVKNERCIQIIFKHGSEHFSFQKVTKKTLDLWLDGFREVLGVPDFGTVQRQENLERLGNLAGDVMEGVGTLIGTGSRMLFEKIGEMAENNRNTQSGGYTGSYRGTRSSSETTGSYRGTVRTEHTERRTSFDNGHVYTYYEETTDGPVDVVDGRIIYEETIEADTRDTAKTTDTTDATDTADAAIAYYLAIDGQPKGPFRLEEVAELAIQGQINRSTLAWTKGMESWQPMETLDGLRSVTENMPPVLG